MGTPDFSVPTLQAVIDHHDVIAVVTQLLPPAPTAVILSMPSHGTYLYLP